jgi:isomaltose glucohydrolase
MVLTSSRSAAAGLVEHSLTVLREGQHPSGAYVACPNYPTYRYAWLRDGAFCAYAMDIRGEHDSAASFHRFIARIMHRHLHPRPEPTREGPAVRLPTRYTLIGEREPVGDDVWPNFQLDGYGTWLWALQDHQRRAGVLDTDILDAAARAADYLATTCHLPCYDCWEEASDRRHTSTLAAMIAGLEAAADLLDRPPLRDRATLLRQELNCATHLRNGSYVKHDATDAIDASLLWLALPFGVVAPHDPRMVATAERVRTELTGPSGGIRRYLGDTFYGGGEWILLTAWWGWYCAARDDRQGATQAARWVQAAATPQGHLPEQLTDHSQRGDHVETWVRKWGPVATPLLWSHAMYLILDDALTQL